MEQILRNIDFFGITPRINIKNEPVKRSYVGAVFSIALITAAILCIILFSSDFVNKTNPTILQTEQPGAIGTTGVILRENQYVFGIYNQLTRTYLNDPTIAYVVSVISVDGVKVALNPLVPCFPPDIAKNYNLTTPNSLMCFPPNSVTNLFGYVNIYIKRCINTTLSSHCKPSSEIDSYLALSLMQVYYYDYNVILNNYENPITSRVNYLGYSFLPGLSVFLGTSMKNIEVVTDDGSLTTINSSVSTTTHETLFYYVNPYIPLTIGNSLSTGGTVFIVKIWHSGNSVSYYRRYKKIQDVLAQVVGICNVLALVFALVARKYAEFQMYVDISNEVLIIDGKFNTKALKENVKSVQEIPSVPMLPALNALEKYSQAKTNTQEQHDCKEREKILSENLHDSDRGNGDKLVESPNKNSKPENLRSLKTRPEGKKIGSIKIEMNDISLPSDISPDENKNQNSHTGHYEDDIEIDTAKHLSLGHNLFSSKNKITAGFKDWLAYMLHDNKKTSKVKEAKRVVDANLDVVMICDKLAELEKLKDLLLSEEQRIIFDAFKKPNVTTEERNSKEGRSNQRHSTLKKVNDLQNAYAQLKRKKNKNKLDKKLLKLIEQNLE